MDDAVTDAATVLEGAAAPLTRTTPLLVRALLTLRSTGTAVDGIDDAWHHLAEFGKHLRLLPAAAIAEQVRLTGVPDERITACRRLLDTRPADGLTMARGELSVWLHRMDPM